MLSEQITIFSLIAWLSSFYVVVNCLRVVKNRSNAENLRRVVPATAIFIYILDLAMVGGNALIKYDLFIGSRMVVNIASGLILLAALLITCSVVSALRHTSFKPLNKFPNDNELPTISICIPARNETSSLRDCLESILASDYPKLEILVLDDDSHDRTPEIIRSFAHDGVRFVLGDKIKNSWLPKNQAYQKLLEESSSQLLLFCGTDVRLQRKSLRTMVSLLQQRQKSMLCLLPTGQPADWQSDIIQPMRYWWELALPRRLFRRPPVLSSLWLVKRQLLKSAGGFGAVKNSVVPEAYFAKRAAKTDEYSFFRSMGELAVGSTKSFKGQRETALRMRYAQVRRKPQQVFVLTLLELGLFISPIILLVWAVVAANWLAALVLAVAIGLLVSNNYRILRLADPAKPHRAIWLFIPSALMEIILGNWSMLNYEFGRVTWKDRDITEPVLN